MPNRSPLLLLLAMVLSLASPPLWAKHHPSSPIRAGQHAPSEQTLSLTGAEATVAFSPNGDATDVIVKTIKRAKRTILVQAYGFTSTPIIKALGQAKARGISVQVILDKSNDSKRYSGATYLRSHNIPVWIDDSVAIAHNKVMVIDDDTVITGSFNFTHSAQTRNAENVMVIAHAPDLARLYAKNWQWRKGLSHDYH